jgi:hypothetical protein
MYVYAPALEAAALTVFVVWPLTYFRVDEAERFAVDAA